MRDTPRALLVHPGTQYSGQLAAQLDRRGLLCGFHTGLAFSAGGPWSSIVDGLPRHWGARLANRRLAGVSHERLHTRPSGELATLVSLRFTHDPQGVLLRRNEAFQRSVPDAAIIGADAVIGFDTSSWILARRTRELERPFILDQSIGHPRGLGLAAERWRSDSPGWPDETRVKSDVELRHEKEEHEGAVRIVVPSRFVARTLRDHGIEEARIRVNPFGTDLERFHPAAQPPPLEPLRFVFAGSLGPRKGLPLLLDTWSRLPIHGAAELWVIGGGHIPQPVRQGLTSSVRLLGRLTQEATAAALRQCHVFVFPSYFEGLAQVQVEAAACGLPIVGTSSSGCEEIVRHGETGFVLSPGDAEALRETLLLFLKRPELALTMRSRLVAEREAWSWDRYGDRWATLLCEAP